MKLPKIIIGDAFIVQAKNGFGIIQCIKDAPKTECEIIRVISGVHGSDANFESIILASKNLFFALMPLKHALKNRMILYIGNYSIPNGSEVPKYFRDKHIIGTDFLGWHIIDSETLQRKLVRELSNEEQQLSPWGTISIPDLVEKIEEGWIPINWR